MSDVTLIVIAALLLVAVSTFLFQFSRYGYHYRAIQGNQKLAADAGINIFSNCVQCYVLAGTLAACAGVFIAAYSGALMPVLGMASNTPVFRNMFPMVLGMWIGGFCNNRQLGVLVGSVSVNLFTIALSKLNMSIGIQNVITYSLFALFIIYLTNKQKIVYFRNKKSRIALAKKMRLERMAVAVSS